MRTRCKQTDATTCDSNQQQKIINVKAYLIAS